MYKSLHFGQAGFNTAHDVRDEPCQTLPQPYEYMPAGAPHERHLVPELLASAPS
jgi:hypothetical protein